MRKLIAVGALLASAIAVVYAQAPFADVPKEHWAYDSVNTLAQRGVVTGYPDGTFAGSRAMTRYEFAVAIARMLPQVQQAIKAQVGPIPPPAASVDLSGLAAKDDLKNLLTKDDFDTVSKLVDQFGPELKMLQVDVAGLRRDLKSLTKRVAAIEYELSRVKISGEMSIIGRGSSVERGSLRRGVQPLDADGRNLQKSNNIIDPAQVYYDTDLNLKLRVSKGVSAHTSLNIGNYLGGFGSYGPRPTVPYGVAGKGSLNAEITPWKAYISAPVHAPLFGDVQLEAGKTGIKFTPYTLRLVDYDSYTNLTKTDSGEAVFNGLKGMFKLGSVGFTAYAGTHASAPSGTGMPLFVTSNYTFRPQNPMTVTSLKLFPGIPAALVELQQSAGVHANLGRGGKNGVGLTYIQAGTAKSSAYFDGVANHSVKGAQVYGANVQFDLPAGIGFIGEFASSLLKNESDFGGNGSVFPTHKHNSYDGRFSMEFGGLGVTAGYRRVEPFFGAPGDWGKIGSWQNPTNIKGFVGSAELALTSRLSVEGGFDIYSSIVRGVNTLVPPAAASASGLGNALENSSNTKLKRFTAGLKYDITNANTLKIGMEQVRFSDVLNPAARSANGTPKESYYNFGLGSALNNSTSLNLLYQIVDYKNHFLTDGENARGNVAVAQFQVKF